MLGKFNIANTVLVGMSQAVSVRPERCNRMCHKSSTCRLCETNCPTQAIKVGAVGTKISVEWDKCSYCGICVNICPTGVYGVREMSYAAFLDTYLKKLTDEGVLKLSCKESTKQTDEEEKEPASREEMLAARTEKLRKGIVGTLRLPDREKASLVECMGIFGLPDILYLYTRGAKEIRFEFPQCANCHNRHGRGILEDELDELEKLSEYFEYLKGTQITRTDDEIRIVFPKQFEKKILAKAEEKAAKRAEPVTRRGMFDMLRQNAMDTALRSASLLTPQEIPNRTPFRDTKEVPVKRKIFLDSIVNLGRLLKEEAPIGPYFFSQEIDNEKCSFCKVCTRFCPTGALHVSEDDKQILFTAAYCTSCGMCKISCYQKFIKTNKTVRLKDFFSDVAVYTRPEKD